MEGTTSHIDNYLFFRLEMLAMSFRHKTVNELYLWSKIRHASRNRAGYFSIRNLTRHERYNLLPTLRKRGWVHKNKNRTIRYKKVAGKMCTLACSVKMPVDCLNSKNEFKAFIHDAVVKYQLEGIHKYTTHKVKGKKRYCRSTNAWFRMKEEQTEVNSGFSQKDKNFRRKYYQVRKFSSEGLSGSKETTAQYVGRLARPITAKFLALSDNSISRFRKLSVANRYKHKRFIYSSRKDIPQMLKFYYDSNSKKDFTISTTVETDVVMFMDKFARNRNRASNYAKWNWGMMVSNPSDKRNLVVEHEEFLDNNYLIGY